MDAYRKAQLQQAGIDADGMLERFMGNEVLVERFLKQFLSDGNMQQLTAALAAGDNQAALTAAHTLKGVCGNLSMSRLYNLLTRQVAAMRADDWQSAADLMPEITQAYHHVIQAL